MAGTSTGSIISGALSIWQSPDSIYPKYSTNDIVNLYKDKKEQIFIKNPFYLISANYY